MSWAVEVQQPAEKQLVALPAQVRKRIARALRALKDNPFAHGVKKLKARDGCRITKTSVPLAGRFRGHEAMNPDKLFD